MQLSKFNRWWDADELTNDNPYAAETPIWWAWEGWCAAIRNSFPSGTHTKFNLGEHVEKISGSKWRGRVVGWYSTALTPEGYAVESDTETGSVQIYPAKALERVSSERS